jgi:hypothetical protein
MKTLYKPEINRQRFCAPRKIQAIDVLIKSLKSFPLKVKVKKLL